MNITIAVVQCTIQQFAPAENLARAEQFIGEATAARAHIIVFPEDFITGPLNGKRAYADSDGTYRKHFQRLAVRYGIDIVPGSIIEEEHGNLYNTTYYIASSGAIKGRYRKLNLWLPERSYITAGSELNVFPTAYGNVGLIICWDLIFPEVFRAMLRQGVEIVICPSYWCFEDAGAGLRHDPLSEVKLVDALCVARAFENEIALVYANAAGSLNNDGVEEHLIGRSQITVPFKGAIARLDSNQQAMFIQEVDTALLRDAETAYEIRRDLNTLANQESSKTPP